jgi:hypothetical protein
MCIKGTILGLYSSFESDLLVEYLRFAILNGLINLSTYLQGFLAEPVSHSLTTYGPLAQLALDIHFATQPILALPTSCLQCALTILRNAFLLQLSPFDRDVVSMSQLTVLLLATSGNTPPASPADAAILWTLISDLLQVYELQPDVRAALETFTVALGIVLGAETRSIQETEPAGDFAEKDSIFVASGDYFDAGLSLLLDMLVSVSVFY